GREGWGGPPGSRARTGSRAPPPTPPTPHTPHTLPQPSPLFGEDLLEQCDRPRVVRLTEPEEGLLTHARTGVGAGDADQGRHAFLMPQLRQGEHGALLHLELHARVVHQLAEPAGRGLAGRLTEPEDGRAPGLARQRGRAGETQQVGPDGDAVRQDGREYGVVASVPGAMRGEVEEIAGGGGGRDGPEIGDRGVPGGAPGAADVGPHPADPPAHLPECHPRRPRLTGAPSIVVVIVAGGDAMPAAAAVVALERDHVAAVAAHTGSRGEGEAHVAV